MVRMTSAERRELSTLANQRARLSKAMIAQRRAEVLADFEKQMAREYDWSEDGTWEEAVKLVEEVAAKATEMVEKRVAEMGIPKQFAPSLHVSGQWVRRGENITTGRRVELRRVATTRLDALEKQAKVAIDVALLNTQTQLLSDGLETDAARSFLESMPTADELLPRLDMSEIKQLTGHADDEEDEF